MNRLMESPEITVGNVIFSGIEGINMNSLNDFFVRAYNNTKTSAIDVSETLENVCGYNHEQAKQYTMKIHNLGQAVVFWGKENVCKTLVDAFSKIGVKSEVVKNE